jgi:hypothetical protein
MTVELRKNLCEDEATKFVWCAEWSMRIRFFEFVANDDFIICVWKKDDSQSWNEFKQIFDVNKTLLEEFRNHLRIARALITKRTTHEAFATLQEKIFNEETTDQEKESKIRLEMSQIETDSNESISCFGVKSIQIKSQEPESFNFDSSRFQFTSNSVKISKNQ